MLHNQQSILQSRIKEKPKNAREKKILEKTFKFLKISKRGKHFQGKNPTTVYQSTSVVIKC